MADGSEISVLSADELMAELRANGLKTGPITPTTRKIFEKKLARARGQKIKSDIEEICVISSNEVIAPQRQISSHGSDTTDFVSSEIRVNNSPNTNETCYYGVCFDRNNTDEGTPAVFTTKHEALQAVKKLKDKGARFKHFKTRHEAEEFSLSLSSNPISSTGSISISSKVTDPASSFKSPKPQELVKFRKIIEKGSSQEFVDLVNSNPKYLISSGDTPVVLQEGFRYNAMHIAAKENKPTMCKLIVETLESDKFWQIYLSVDKETVTRTSHERKQVLVDLYLNTPDKGNFETPLHFACKFGHIDVVEYLVSHPLTNVNPRNKYGETADQVACSRCSSQTSVIKIKERIRHLLEDNYYVPVFGSEGDATPPRIGEPWSPDIHNKGKSTPSFTSPGLQSPASPKVIIRAYAGPMSPNQAFEFHHQWKTPPSKDRKKYANIKRGDSTRGIERIGRSLAHSHDIPWAEYWDFLGYFVDFAKPSGLEILEEYFDTKQKQIISEDASVTPNKEVKTDPFSTPASGRSNVSDVFISDTEDNSPLNMNNKMTTNDDTSPTFQHKGSYTPTDLMNQKNSLNTKSPLPPQTDVSHESHRNSSKKTQALTLDFDKLSISPESKENEIVTEKNSIPSPLTFKDPCLSETPNSKASMKSPGDEMELDLILCKKNLFGELNDTSDKEDETIRNQVNVVDMRIQNHYYPMKNSQKDSGMLSKEDDVLIEKQALNSKGLDVREDTGNIEKSCISQSSEDSLVELVKKLHIDLIDNNSDCHAKGNKFVSEEPQSRYVFTSPEENKPCDGKQRQSTVDVTCNSQVDAGCFRASNDCEPSQEEKKMMLFIDGFYPSKLDLDVLRALNGVTIKRDKYPLVSQWRDMVMSYTTAVRESWPSPGSPHFKKRHKSMMVWSN